jgi:hypothetical protein
MLSVLVNFFHALFFFDFLSFFFLLVSFDCISVVIKAGSGRMSPALTRTMKEYDQLINDLKKENFSLKLRIYFLEEKIPKYDGDTKLLKTVRALFCLSS